MTTVPSVTTTSEILRISDLTLVFGGVSALVDVTFGVARGSVCGLIGPNGAGKSSLFNCVSRVYTPTSGTITYREQDLLGCAAHKLPGLGIGRTFQNLALFPELTVIENVMLGAHASSSVGALRAALRLGLAGEERKLRDRAYSLLEALGLARIANDRCAGHSYGTLKRIDLARALANDPSLLLLDEPAAGLTQGEVHELTQVLLELAQSRSLTLLLVEHHMGMVMAMSHHLVVLDAGRKIAEGAPAEVRKDPRVIEAYLGAPA